MSTRVCSDVVEQLNSAASVPRGFVVAESSTNDAVAPPSVINHNQNSVNIQLQLRCAVNITKMSGRNELTTKICFYSTKGKNASKLKLLWACRRYYYDLEL